MTFFSFVVSNVCSASPVVAVIDSGIEMTHPKFQGRFWENILEKRGLPGVDDDGNGFVDDVHGYNFVDRIGDTSHQSVNDHGTHVAGLVLDGAGFGGPDSDLPRLMILNVYGSSVFAAPVEALDEAIRYAARMGAEVINISATSRGRSPSTESAILEAVAGGSIVVAAAGNEQADLDVVPAFPASMGAWVPEVISVAAVDLKTHELCPSSSFGKGTVWLAAPGCDRSAPRQGIRSARRGGIYGYKSGTSQAAPWVSGAIAGWRAEMGTARLTHLGPLARAWLQEQVLSSPELRAQVQSGGAMVQGVR